MDRKMLEKTTEAMKRTSNATRIRVHHLRLPFIRDIYWTSLRNLILEFPIRLYFAVKREGVQGRHVLPVNILGFRFELLHTYATILPDELPMWERNYLPVSVKGKVVLDVGAGCGETSAFYIAHGARKVVAIEPDKRAFSLLLKNMKTNCLNVVPIRKPFELTDLLIPHDLLKVDAEGAEVALLDYQGTLGDCVVEAHTIGSNRTHLGPIIAKKFGLKVVGKFGKREDVWLLSSA